MLDHSASSKKGSNEVSITINKDGKSKTLALNCTWDQYQEGLKNYKAGQFMQDAFKFLDDGQREFLITGITPEEWTEMFGNEEDEEE